MKTGDSAISQPAQVNSQSAFEESLKRILSLPKEKIAQYKRERKSPAKTQEKKPHK